MTKLVKSVLRVGIVSGAVALLPTVALAGTGAELSGGATAERVDHATVEARGAGAVTPPDGTAQTTAAIPDHETAEARGVAPATGVGSVDTTAGVPDHAAAEARGAIDENGR